MLLGSIAPLGDSVFATDELYLGITIDPNPEMPRQRLTSVAYAQRVGRVDASDMFNEPGVASNILPGGVDLTNTTQTLLTRNITPPGPGYVLAIGSCNVRINHIVGTSSTAFFGVSTTPGSFPDNQTVAIVMPAAAATGDYWQAVTVHGLFTTIGGGDGFWFYGEQISGDLDVYDMQFTSAYFPTAYGEVLPTSGALMTANSGSKVESELFEKATMAPTRAGVDVRIGALERELQILKARIEREEK